MVMPYIPLEIKSIDTTETDQDRRDAILRIRLQKGKTAFATLLTDIEKEAQDIELKQQIEHTERVRQTQAKQQAENTPIHQFIRSIKTHTAQPQELEKWKHESRQTLETVYNEFTALASRNGIPLNQQDIDFGVGFLNTLLSTSPPQPPHRWIDKIAH